MDWKNNIIADENVRKAASGMGLLFTEEFLIGKSNRGTYKRAIKDLDGCEKIEASLSDDNILVNMDGVSVSVSRDFSGCSCSCAAKTVCRHIIAAAAVCGVIGESTGDAETTAEISENIASEENIKPEKEKKIPDAAFLSEVMRTAEGIIIKGIMNCSQNDEDVLLRLSLRAGAACRVISNLCRSLAENIKLMNQKNAEFSPVSASAVVCRLYNTAYVMTHGCGELLLKRNGYCPEGNGSFMCLGIYPRHSKSGYAGVTAVCYEKERREFFTYNVTRPDFYSSTENAGTPEQLKRLLSSRSHWQNGTSLSHISGKNFTLYNFKADERMRISSSKQTSCLYGETIQTDELGEELMQLPVYEEYDYFLTSRADRFFLVKNPVFSKIRFISSAQTLTGFIAGDNADMLPLEIEFSDISRAAVHYIENHADVRLDGSYMLVRVFGRSCLPVSIIGRENTINFWFQAVK